MNSVIRKIVTLAPLGILAFATTEARAEYSSQYTSSMTRAREPVVRAFYGFFDLGPWEKAERAKTYQQKIHDLSTELAGISRGTGDPYEFEYLRGAVRNASAQFPDYVIDVDFLRDNNHQGEKILIKTGLDIVGAIKQMEQVFPFDTAVRTAVLGLLEPKEDLYKTVSDAVPEALKKEPRPGETVKDYSGVLIPIAQALLPTSGHQDEEQTEEVLKRRAEADEKKRISKVDKFIPSIASARTELGDNLLTYLRKGQGLGAGDRIDPSKVTVDQLSFVVTKLYEAQTQMLRKLPAHDQAEIFLGTMAHVKDKTRFHTDYAGFKYPPSKAHTEYKNLSMFKKGK